jgi:hypothetical protein
LDIYARRGPVLDRDFPWGTIEQGPGGDKLYRKRPHRFAFSPRLALAAFYGESSDRVLREVLLGWMSFASSAENALAYDSNLAVIQRVLALSWAWTFLAGRENPTPDDLTLEALVLQVIHEDAKFLAPRLGDSQANNHLLADAFAGWFLGVVWPELAGEDLRERFEPQWLHELERQTLADSTSFEHSTHYHEYGCEMAAAYLILSRRNGLPVPDWVQERTRRALEFQAALAGPEAATLAIGDSAEDPLFPLDGGDGWATASWSELLRGLFSSQVPYAPNDAPSGERAFWLLGGSTAQRASVEGANTWMKVYPQGGYSIFRDGALDSSLVFRTGPNPREALSPGHMHSDLMSVYVSSMGKPLIVDAGTYTYRGKSAKWPSDEPDWRNYFRGPAAHNTLNIEGHDPLGAVEGDFRRDVHSFVATEKTLSDPGCTWVDAVLEGRGDYSGYRRGIIHVRGEYWIIYDVLPKPKPNQRRSFGFQLVPECSTCAQGERGVEIALGSATVCLTGSGGLLPPVVVKGSRHPLGGWVSPRYGELVGAPQVRFSLTEGACVTAFLVRPIGDRTHLESATIEVDTAEPNGLRLGLAIGSVEDTLLLNFRSCDIEVRSKGMTFRGDLARMRHRAGLLENVRWLNGQSLGWSDAGLVVHSPLMVPSLTLDAGKALSPPSTPAGLSVSWPM